MKKIALLIEPGATASSIMTTLDMLRIAARLQPDEDYRLDLFSTKGGTVCLSEAVAVKTQPLPADLAAYAAIILPGFFASSVEHIAAQLETTWRPAIAKLKELTGKTVVAASCYGTFVLAEAGLLNGKQATTTWWMEKEFSQRYPKVLLDADKALIDSGNVITAGAMTAHTDLSLHVLRRLSGVSLARGDRGREEPSLSPPSEPHVRFSRIRLSSWWFPHRDWLASAWASFMVKIPSAAKYAFGHRL